jgi:hypothetical protein
VEAHLLHFIGELVEGGEGNKNPIAHTACIYYCPLRVLAQEHSSQTSYHRARYLESDPMVMTDGHGQCIRCVQGELGIEFKDEFDHGPHLFLCRPSVADD